MHFGATNKVSKIITQIDLVVGFTIYFRFSAKLILGLENKVSLKIACELPQVSVIMKFFYTSISLK